MPIPYVIDALRELSPHCPGGEAVLLEAAECLEQMFRALAAPAQASPEWILPPPVPTR